MVMGDPFIGHKDQGIDRTKLRLAALGVLIVAAFFALFSRLWFLQVLASDTYQNLAKENRVRRVHTEPTRGRIMDRNGVVLVRSRPSLTVTLDRSVLESRRKTRMVLRRLSRHLDEPVKEMRDRLDDVAVSPYKSVPVVYHVGEREALAIAEVSERFPGVEIEERNVRIYPEGSTAAHLLGYVGEITREALKSDHFKDVKPPYQAGDTVGREGLEYVYDRWLRGRPGIERVIVNSTGDVIDTHPVQGQQYGKDLVLSLDVEIQKLAERALKDGIEAARGSYVAPNGGVVVLDPNDGGVVAMASYPTFNPSMLSDGLSPSEYRELSGDPSTNSDDKNFNRVIQTGIPPGSIFKTATAGAAMWTGVATPYTYLSCPGAIVLPPGGGPGSVSFPNWTTSDFGTVGFPESLEISCDTFYYQLGWEMEERWGAANGTGEELFQKYLRQSGFGRPTGVDLPYETAGRVPDEKWCKENYDLGYCDGQPQWLPGYTVNMSIGQGDLIVSPLQMAVSYAALVNGGRVVQPHVASALAEPNPETGVEEVVREIKPKTSNELPLDEAELAVLREGLEDVVMGANGTAAGAFAGFPFDEYPVAGKTGTAQIGESDQNYAWFLSYGPTDAPEYVIAVYIERAGHGGESAAPIARQIWEGLAGFDEQTDVQLNPADESG